MTSLPLPITLATASVLALFALVLATRVSAGRVKQRISVGDGGNPDMVVRMRTHANFSEYVPLLLILMGLLEIGGANRLFLLVTAIVLVIARIAHAVGMPRPAPNPWRAGGATITYALLVIYAVYGLVLAFSVGRI